MTVPAPPPVIDLDGVGFTYPDGHRALDGFTLAVGTGESEGTLFFFGTQSEPVLTRTLGVELTDFMMQQAKAFKCLSFVDIDTADKLGHVQPMRVATNMEFLDRKLCQENGE